MTETDYRVWDWAVTLWAAIVTVFTVGAVTISLLAGQSPWCLLALLYAACTAWMTIKGIKLLRSR